MAAIGAVASLLGTVVSAAGTIAAGKAQQQQADIQAMQMEQQASQERAAAQRESKEERKRRDFALSRLQALSSASGFMGTDPSTLDTFEDIWSTGEFRAALKRYGGEQEGQKLRYAAEGARFSGQAAAQGAKLAALGGVLGGVGSFANSFYGRYGQRSTRSQYA